MVVTRGGRILIVEPKEKLRYLVNVRRDQRLPEPGFPQFVAFEPTGRGERVSKKNIVINFKTLADEIKIEPYELAHFMAGKRGLPLHTIREICTIFAAMNRPSSKTIRSRS